MVAEIFTVLVALFGIAAYAMVKGKKRKLQAAVLGAALVGVGLFGLGAFGAPTLFAGPPSEPRAGALWAVTFNSGSATDRTGETEIISPDGHTINYYLADVDMDALGDVDLEADVSNMNAGETTDVWGPLEVSIVEIGTVIVSGVATPVANYTADRSRFNVAYSLTTAGAPTLVQVHDKAYSRDWTTGSSDELNIDLPIDPAVTDDAAAGNSFRLVYNVGGIILTCIITEP